jgi:hypothetical protein
LLYALYEQHATEDFDYAVIAVGQSSQPKAIHSGFPTDRKLFAGDMITTNDIQASMFIAKYGSKVEHILRTTRWLVPFGIIICLPSSLEFSSVMIPCWDQPSAVERFPHKELNFLVNGLWVAISWIVRLQMIRAALG